MKNNLSPKRFQTARMVAAELFEPSFVLAFDGKTEHRTDFDARVVIIYVEEYPSLLSYFDLKSMAKSINEKHYPNRLFVYGTDRPSCAFIAETLADEMMRIQCTARGVEALISCPGDFGFPNEEEMKDIENKALACYALIMPLKLN